MGTEDEIGATANVDNEFNDFDERAFPVHDDDLNAVCSANASWIMADQGRVRFRSFDMSQHLVRIVIERTE